MPDRTDILFRTNRFNVSDPRPYFINECCFGDDAANWLRLELIEHKVEVQEPYQEDWGWEMFATCRGTSYFLGLGGLLDNSAPTPNYGEWRVMISKVRSIKDKLTGRNKMTSDEGILVIVEDILKSQSDIRLIGRE